jgi:YD repeat-containing protein
VTTRTFDAVSRLVTQTNPLGRLTWYLCDGLNRLATRTDPLSCLNIVWHQVPTKDSNSGQQELRGVGEAVEGGVTGGSAPAPPK